jgi:hypothetical protein
MNSKTWYGKQLNSSQLAARAASTHPLTLFSQTHRQVSVPAAHFEGIIGMPVAIRVPLPVLPGMATDVVIHNTRVAGITGDMETFRLHTKDGYTIEGWQIIFLTYCQGRCNLYTAARSKRRM